MMATNSAPIAHTTLWASVRGGSVCKGSCMCSGEPGTLDCTGIGAARYTTSIRTSMSTSAFVETTVRTAQSAVTFAPHILVVDDDPDICRLISDYLTEFGLRVSCAG